MIEVKENKEFKGHKVINGENMKQGWEIKKLGEVCKIQTGKLDANAKVDDGVYPFFTCDAKPYRINTYAFDDKAILISGNGSLVGHINYYNGKFNAYQRTYVLTQFISFYIPFLICYLKGFLRSYIIENKKGGCIPYITLPILQDFTIPCPPLPEQERIVAELDCLSGIIEKKKQQLKELDALAESIFYTMFGDPITNEKGWEIKTIKEVAPQQEYKGDVPCKNGKYWLLNLDMVAPNTGEIIEQCLFEYEDIGNSTIKFNSDNVLYSKLRPYLNKVVVPNDIGYATSELVPLCPKKGVLNRVFFASILRSSHFVKYISSKVAGAKMPRVAMGEFREFCVILPPLPLQQEFADKIEAIEKQKELIKESIKETEELFNSRMDYYFG